MTIEINVEKLEVRAEIDVINASWDTEGNHQGLADSIGLMVYEGTNVSIHSWTEFCHSGKITFGKIIKRYFTRENGQLGQ